MWKDFLSSTPSMTKMALIISFDSSDFNMFLMRRSEIQRTQLCKDKNQVF